MNWKLILIGGVAFWLVTNLLGFATGPLIHTGKLDPIYRANEAFWVPALNQDPPDIAAMMPIWLRNSLIASLVYAAIYGMVHPSLGAPGWRRGLTFGLILAVLAAVSYLSFSGLFNLPDELWLWWALEALVVLGVGGVVLGWVGERFCDA